MARGFLIYGAYGYTGELIARQAVAQGLRPVLGGRNGERVAALAKDLGLEARVFPLDDPAALDAGLEGMDLVIHCAGPFSQTALAMAEGCLRTRTHYLDITGEVDVFEALAAMDKRAVEAGVMLLPGGGFDVVPSDCLAAHLKAQLGTATKLLLAFQSTGHPSHGTTLTVLQSLFKGTTVRQNGVLTQVPAAWKTRSIDFGKGPKTAVTITWGDVSTAFYSTAIPDIEVYMAASFGLRVFLHATRYLGPLLDAPPVLGLLRRHVDAGGPSDAERAAGFSLLWGQVTDDAGQRAEARLRTPDGYSLTVLSALLIARKVLEGNAPPGFKTPSLAYGPDLVLEIEGVTRR